MFFLFLNNKIHMLLKNCEALKVEKTKRATRAQEFGAFKFARNGQW